MLGAVYGVIAGNLALFIAVTGAPAFQALHHHWIFPLLAGVLAFEWSLTGGIWRLDRSGSAGKDAARTTVLSLLAFLILMGIVRHDSILTCFGRCAFKLAGAALIAAAVFAAESRRGGAGFWVPARAEAAGLGCLLWALYLLLLGLGSPSAPRDIAFFALAAGLGFSRGRPAARLAAAGIPPAIALSWVSYEPAAIAGGLAIAGAGLWAAGRSS